MSSESEDIAVQYMQAIAAAMDEVSLQHGATGDMGAALAALSACQAQLISTLKEGRTRKLMRDRCAMQLLQYLTAASGDDRRGESKRTLAVLPPEIH